MISEERYVKCTSSPYVYAIWSSIVHQAAQIELVHPLHQIARCTGYILWSAAIHFKSPSPLNLPQSFQARAPPASAIPLARGSQAHSTTGSPPSQQPPMLKKSVGWPSQHHPIIVVSLLSTAAKILCATAAMQHFS